MKKKTLVIFIVSLVLVAAAAVGGTIAWLSDTTDPVENVFTVGDINITLEETTEEYKIIPGSDIEKDPVVTVEAGSEACWLFVKITETNWSDKLTYTIADGWTALEGSEGVYYRQVDATTADTEFQVLANDTVSCSEDLTKAELEAMNNAAPKLTIQAYAIQSENIATAAEAAAALGL